VDSVTHALLVATLLTLVGGQEFIIFGIIGAVILDADILFTFVSRRRPGLYLFIHGGAAHSIAGSAMMAACAYLIFFLVSASAGAVFPSPLYYQFGIPALLCTIGGAWVHVALDFLATPGIPVFWPYSEKKYTAGIFAGPSFFMIVVSWTFLILVILGAVPLSFLWLYGALFIAFLIIRGSIRIIALIRLPAETFPTFNPLRWMVIRKEGGSWWTGFFTLTGNGTGEAKTYPACTGLTADEMKAIEFLPEVRRVRYHSYFTVAELNGETITIKDPLREDGTLRYPPYYSKVVVRKDGTIIESR
jgi:inner membrane protein